MYGVKATLTPQWSISQWKHSSRARDFQTLPRSSWRSVAVRTCGVTSGCAVPGMKNGLSRYLPLRRELPTLRRILSTARKAGHGVVFTVPLADAVLMATFAGPNVASSSVGDPARQLCTKPTYESLGSRGVLPIGVQQHAVYQRRSPLSLSDMQRSSCLPRTIRRKRGLVATMSVPARSLRIRSGLPRNRANA